MGTQKITTFEEFWPYYIGEHQNPLCRTLHYIGTSFAIGLLLVSVLTLNAWLLLGVPFLGYGFAWIGHFIVEKNRPATFTYPRWSFLGDLKMLLYFVTGRMDAEFKRLEKQGFQYVSHSGDAS